MNKFRYLFSTRSGVLCQGTLFDVHGRLIVAIPGARRSFHGSYNPLLNSYSIPEILAMAGHGVAVPCWTFTLQINLAIKLPSSAPLPLTGALSITGKETSRARCAFNFPLPWPLVRVRL